jgi:hypothetical protein
MPAYHCSSPEPEYRIGVLARPDSTDQRIRHYHNCWSFVKYRQMQHIIVRGCYLAEIPFELALGLPNRKAMSLILVVSTDS